MFYKLGKDTLKYLLNICHFLQIFLVFLAFFTTFYWMFKLGNAPFIPAIAPIFEPISDFTHLFYQRTVTTGDVTIDFSFLIASLTMLFIVWLLNFAISFFEDLEAKYEKMYKNMKKIEEKNLNISLEQKTTQMEKDNNKFLILLSFNINNLMHDAKFNSNLDKENAKKMVEVMDTFAEKAGEVLKCQKKAYDNSILLYLNDFDEIDAILTRVSHLIDVLKAELATQNWKFKFFAGIEVYSKNSEVVEKCKNLFALNRLNLANEIICVASFNQRYSLIENPIFEVSGKGIYKISGNEVDVYCINKKRS